MPRGNRMGPRGEGPMTGRGLGRCAGVAMSSGMGWQSGGYGRGRGHRNMYYATGQPRWARAGFVPPMPTAEQELGELKAQADWLAGQLDVIQKHIKDIEGHGFAPAEQ